MRQTFIKLFLGCQTDKFIKLSQVTAVSSCRAIGRASVAVGRSPSWPRSPGRRGRAVPLTRPSRSGGRAHPAVAVGRSRSPGRRGPSAGRRRSPRPCCCRAPGCGCRGDRAARGRGCAAGRRTTTPGRWGCCGPTTTWQWPSVLDFI